MSALARQMVALPGGEPTEERRALLIPLTDLDRASRVLGELTGPEVAARLTGPLPAYSFLDVAAEAPASRWGW